MNKIALQYIGMSQVVTSTHLGLIVLADMQKQRQVAIVMAQNLEREFVLRKVDKQDTGTSLPEVLVKTNPDMNSEHYEVLINSIKNGVYKSYLVCKDDLSFTPILTPEALLLAHIANLEIYMEERLFNVQSAPYNENTGKMALPINALSSEMLEHALSQAVQDEKYEMASMLRDELNKRKQK